MNELNSNVKKYDLKERTAIFGERIIRFAKKIPVNIITKPIIEQMIRAGTSLGANYMEADGAESRKDFIHKIGICKKEAKETQYWLRIINTAANIIEKDEHRWLTQEATELVLIFSSIIRSSKK